MASLPAGNKTQAVNGLQLAQSTYLNSNVHSMFKSGPNLN